MLILSIAGGIAFTYKDFVEGGERKGKIISVIRGNWLSFFQDYRLIKPRRRGFKSSFETEELEKRISERFLKEYQCDINLNELKSTLSAEYL